MVELENLKELINDLILAKEHLEKLREDFKDDPELLSFYEPSAIYLINQLKERIYKEISLITGEPKIQPDLLVKIEGKAFKKGRAPVGILSNFLKCLNTANKHAISILENIDYKGGRFINKIRELAELRLVSIEPGSLCLGFEPPDPEWLLDRPPEQMSINPEKEIIELTKASKKSLEGISLLLLALNAAKDNDSLTILQDKVKEQKNILKLLYFARQLTPSSVSNINSISFYAKKLLKTDIPVVADTKTRERLQEISKEIVQREEYVEATGIIRAIDLDKPEVKIRPILIKDEMLEEIDGKLKIDLSESEKEYYFNRKVYLAGFLKYTEKGEIQRLEIDEISDDTNESYGINDNYKL